MLKGYVKHPTKPYQNCLLTSAYLIVPSMSCILVSLSIGLKEYRLTDIYFFYLSSKKNTRHLMISATFANPYVFNVTTSLVPTSRVPTSRVPKPNICGISLWSWASMANYIPFGLVHCFCIPSLSKHWTSFNSNLFIWISSSRHVFGICL